MLGLLALCCGERVRLGAEEENGQRRPCMFGTHMGKRDYMQSSSLSHAKPQ
jgi:hypothetical protein